MTIITTSILLTIMTIPVLLLVLACAKLEKNQYDQRLDDELQMKALKELRKKKEEKKGA